LRNDGSQPLRQTCLCLFADSAGRPCCPNRQLQSCAATYARPQVFLTMKDMKSMKGQRTKLFKPCFNRRTLKLIRKPCLMPDSFM